MIFGLLTFGSMRKARWLFARNSSGKLSVVPRKLTPDVVPALPFKLQAVPAAAALVQTKLAPLYDSTCPLAGVPGVFSCVADTAPLTRLLAVVAVAALGVKRAYGVGSAVGAG